MTKSTYNQKYNNLMPAKPLFNKFVFTHMSSNTTYSSKWSLYPLLTAQGGLK